MEKHSKSTKQKARPREIKSSEGKADLTTSWEIDPETQVRQGLDSNSLNLSSSSITKNAGRKKEKQLVGSLTKNDTNMSDYLRETKKASLKGGPTFPGSMNDKHFELFESTNNVAGSSGNEVILSNEQHNSKASMLEKAFEERSTNNHKVEKSNLQSEGRSKVEKYFDMTNTHLTGCKRKNEQITEPDDHVKPSSPPYKEKTLQRKDQISDGKKKVKLSQANSESFGNNLKDSISGNSSATPKEKKKTSHAKAGHAEKKSKVRNSRTDLSGAAIRESSGYENWDVKTELLENGVGSLDFRSKGKQKATKAKHEKQPIMSTHIFNEKPVDRNAEKTQIPGASVSEKTQIPGAFVNGHILAASSTYNAPATGATVFVETDIGGSSNKVIANNEPRWNSFPLSKGSKCDLNVNYSSSKKLGDEVQSITNGESKQHFVATDVDKLSTMDISTKKKKGKERQGSQHGEESHVTGKHVLENEVIVQRAPGPAEPVNKKVELTMSVGKGSKTTKLNNRMDTKGNITKMILPASGEHLTAGMDDEVPYVVEKKHRSSQSEGNIASQRALDFDSSKRDVMFTQPPVAEAANSSSSKVSGSHKSRSNLQETKGSPVESVSSSPLRIPSIEKLSHKSILEQKSGATNSGFPALGKPRICSDSEFDGRSGRSGKGKKPFSVQKAADSGILDSLEGTSDYLRKERNKSSDGKSEERLHVKLSAHNGSSPAELGKHSYKDDIQDLDKVNGHQLVNDSSQRKSGKNSSGLKEKHRGSKSVLDKSRLKVSGSYNEHKDLHSVKNGSNGRLEGSFVSGEHACPDDLRNEEGNFQGEDEKEFLGKKDPNLKYIAGRRGNSSPSVVQENMDGVPSLFSNPQRDLDSKIPVGMRCVKPDFQVGPSFLNEKALSRPYLDRINCPEPPSGLGKSQLKLTSCDKLDTQPRGRHDVVDAVNADTSRVVKQHRPHDCHNGLHNNNLRHATPFVSDSSSPLRKENCAAVLKEARDLKHSANRLKVISPFHLST
ncbi:hypothetical protein BHE74_00027813 [Ensete ventricosum]|nr:hypothetical protein GW17_00006662 [Ensete ventricosum]RWW64914.1 hypothetical protein BHE74_00027813 [Ensete ventricosum]